jgi:hypothetical protein
LGCLVGPAAVGAVQGSDRVYGLVCHEVAVGRDVMPVAPLSRLLRGLREGRQAEYVPQLAPCGLPFQEDAAYVCFVPVGEAQHAHSVEGGHARIGLGVVPVDLLLPDNLRVRVLPTSQGVVYQEAVVDEYAVSKEVVASFHLDVINSDAMRAYCANQGHGV